MAALAAAGIGAASSLLGGASSKKSASKAARIQAAAYNNGIAEQKSEFNTEQANEQPYMQAGNSGLSALTTLLGLGGNGLQGQQDAITNLQQSPLYTSQYNTGVNTILQNASATGGLRGGNVNNSLAQYGSSLLSNVIQNQLGNYSGLIGVGQNAAAGTNAAATSTGNAITGLTTAAGGSAANGIAGAANSTNNTITGLSSALQQILKGSSSGSGSTINTAYNGLAANDAISQILASNPVAGFGV